MDWTFVLCPNIIGVFGLSILLIFTKFNFYLKKRDVYFFRTAILVNIAIITFEVLDYFFVESSFSSAYILRRFSTAICFSLTPVIPFFIAQIARRKPFALWTYLPAALNALLYVLSIFVSPLALISAQNYYSRNLVFYVMVVVSVLYLCVVVWISFRNLKDARFSEFFFLIFVVVVLLLCNLLEIFQSFHFIIWNCCAILQVSYYLFLHIQAFKYDVLTNVLNRNMFFVELEQLSHKKVTILSMDLDHLKLINDTQGHKAGDAYLVSSVRVMEECFGEIGKIYRIGGDEFIVLAVNAEESAVQSRLAQFQNRCKAENISVSYGYVTSNTDDDLQEILHQADTAMYAQKREKKSNRSV